MLLHQASIREIAARGHDSRWMSDGNFLRERRPGKANEARLEMFAQHVSPDFGYALAGLNLNALRRADKYHLRLQLRRHPHQQLARHVRRGGEQHKLSIVQRFTKLACRLDARRYFMRREVSAVDVLLIDAVNHFNIVRPEPYLMPCAPGDDAQRRPPTSRTDDCDSTHGNDEHGNDERGTMNDELSFLPRSAFILHPFT